MWKTFGSIISGIGVASVFFFLSKQVTEMPTGIAIVGYAVGGLFILYGVACVFVSPKKIWEVLMSIRLRSPLFLKKNENYIAVNPIPIWLEQAIESDKSDLASRIYARDYKWDLRKLTEPDPYVDLVFTIINAAVFAINIQDVTGLFLIENHECSQKVEVSCSKRIPHGESQNIHIRQRLTSEMADLIIRKRKPEEPQKLVLPTYRGKVDINLRDCKLLINAEIEGESQKNISIAIGTEHEVSFR